LTGIKATGEEVAFASGTMASDARSAKQRDREAFFAQLSRYMNGLYRYARHLLRYYQDLGDLPPGQIEVEDIVDTAVLEAYRELGKAGTKADTDRDLKRRLMSAARRYVQNEIRQATARSKLMVSTEENVPETPPEQEVSLLGEEIFEFFEPDENLKVEDVVPDLEVPDPEQVAETEDLRQCVNSALTGMPAEWRRVLTLRFVQGVKGAALARALGKSGPETSRILERARAHLRQRLVEAGCSFTPEGEGGRRASPNHARP
jgi:RNA polymerase sigma factor (sigma-70 family)